MKLITEKINRYKNIKKKEKKTLKERKFERAFSRACYKLNTFDRDFFYKAFLEEGPKDWWKKYYTRKTYLRMRENILEKFSILFAKYEN